MRILKASEQPVSAWKNGGGRTRAVAIAPEGATLDDFDWRLSVAEVASDGPFSAFPGVDRTLALLAGAGMVLTAREGSATLRQPGDRWDFPGEWAVHGGLLDGPTLDLNLMVRRGRAVARLEVVPAEASVGAPWVVVVDGEVWAGDERLGVGDAVQGGALRGPGRVAALRLG